MRLVSVFAQWSKVEASAVFGAIYCLIIQRRAIWNAGMHKDSSVHINSRVESCIIGIEVEAFLA